MESGQGPSLVSPLCDRTFGCAGWRSGRGRDGLPEERNQIGRCRPPVLRHGGAGWEISERGGFLVLGEQRGWFYWPGNLPPPNHDPGGGGAVSRERAARGGGPGPTPG